jgi:hypothetical protein
MRKKDKRKKKGKKKRKGKKKGEEKIETKNTKSSPEPPLLEPSILIVSCRG